MLDTHAFLWFIAGDSQLSQDAQVAIADAANDVLLSAASLWELAIKLSLGRLSLDGPFESFIAEQLPVNSIDLLPISLAHVTRVATLPFHHRDPFDRLLIAQALVDDLVLVSNERLFDSYAVRRLW